MERLRAKTPSPVPFKKTTSCGSLLDQILGKNVADLSASNGFGLKLPYLHNQKYKLPPSARLNASLPNSPRVRSGRPASPVALAKSPSVSIENFLPGTPTSDAPMGAAEEDEEGVADATYWRCRMCPNHGPDGLEPGADSFMVCRHCGTTDRSPQLVSQTRSKNCAESEDKTDVADKPVADARTVEMEAYANGPETSDERRRRHLNTAGGSYVPKKTLKLKDMGEAQSSLDKVKTREVRDRMDASGRDATKKRAILRMVEAVFDQIPTLDKRVRKFIRLKSLRIYEASMNHDKVCGHPGCMITISARSNAVVGTCVVEHALKQLCSGTTYVDGEALPNQILAETAPEVSPQQLTNSLELVKSLELRHASANQRLQVSSAIAIIDGWGFNGHCTRCAEQPPAPPELQLPASMMSSSRDNGKSKHASPADCITEKLLRERVVATAKLWHSPPQVRNHALEALTYEPILAFLTEMGTPDDDEGFPIDVMAIALLLASSRCLDYQEELPPFATNIFEQFQLATSTVNEHVTSIAEVMMDTMQAKEENDLF